jgi:hypothetical protein
MQRTTETKIVRLALINQKESSMKVIAAVSARRHSILGLIIAAASLVCPQAGWAQCAAPAEEGRWRNLDNNGEPSYIDVKMVGGCGDTGGESSLRYTLRVWVRQSSGQYYGRPTVYAAYRPWKGVRWLYGAVTTGGYQDQMWMVRAERDGKPQLHVLIEHKSLDSKPSASSEYWFVR